MPASLMDRMVSNTIVGSASNDTSPAMIGGQPQQTANNHQLHNHNTMVEDNRAVKLAYELAMLGIENTAPAVNHSPPVGDVGTAGSSPITVYGGGGEYAGHSNSALATLEDLKSRKSQNMTECVPVPSSEHVAEIVGRQGCKIKALRAKTNTYIKTPVRGEEPVFVVTGRKEDVALAKREILSAAEHFSQIRASRKNNINSTLAFGQLVANTPGQTTIQVRVPYRVVGLVVGPKGATIKRIQQQTHTYIVTPSREKEPVFEVTGLPENVDTARKEIEAHIALRTGNNGSNDGLFDSVDSLVDDSNQLGNGSLLTSHGLSSFSSFGGGAGSTTSSVGSSSHGGLMSSNDSMVSSNNAHNLLTKYSTNTILNGMNNGSSMGGNNGISNGVHHNNIMSMGSGGGGGLMNNVGGHNGHHHHQHLNNQNHLINNRNNHNHFDSELTQMNQHHHHNNHHGLALISDNTNNFDAKFRNFKTAVGSSSSSLMNNGLGGMGSAIGNGTTSIGSSLWGCSNGGGSESHDSGIGHSPPFHDSGLNSLSSMNGGGPSSNSLGGGNNGTAIWQELGKVLGNLTDSPPPMHQQQISNNMNAADSMLHHHHHNNGGMMMMNGGGVIGSKAVASRSASIDLGIVPFSSSSNNSSSASSSIGGNIDMQMMNGVGGGSSSIVGHSLINNSKQLAATSSSGVVSSTESSSLLNNFGGGCGSTSPTTLAGLSASLTTLNEQPAAVGGGAATNGRVRSPNGSESEVGGSGLLNQQQQAFVGGSENGSAGIQSDFLSFSSHH